MPEKPVKNGNGAVLGFEETLWKAADKLRNNMDAAEYKHVVLGLIFLKYINDAFDERKRQLEQELANPDGKWYVKEPQARYEVIEDRDEFVSANVFWVPKAARWETLRASAKQPTIGKLLDDAMVAIEKDNPTLKGVLPKDYARPMLDKRSLGELIDMFSSIGLGDAENRSKDILGRVYEYFLSQFASAEGKKGGQFYTPRCVVRVLVSMLAPSEKSRIFDPCCGSGGMFVQSEEFIEAHGGRRGAVAIYGQESNHTTWRLAKMNLAIRHIDANLGQEPADSFLRDQHKDLKADFIVANPPFNMSDWGGEQLREDIRWKYGTPPTGNANFAWVQHFVHHLAPRGVAGFILGNISLTSETGGEDVIRKGIVDANLVDCIVTLPDKLFYSTPIPVGIWILSRSRESSEQRHRQRTEEILFIDASKLGEHVTRTHRELTDADIRTIADTYRLWLQDPENYTDHTSFCCTVPVKKVIANNYNLLPAAYVNTGHVQATKGPHLRDVISGPTRDTASQSLAKVAKLDRAFQNAVQDVAARIAALEDSISFRTLELGELLESSDERLGDAEEPEVLTCTEAGGLILQKERFAKRVATADARKYKIVRRGDIIYNPYLLWKGSIDQCWIVDVGITSPAYEVLRVRPGFDRTIVGQLLTSPEMIKRYDGISFGTVQRRRRAPIEKFLELKVNVPAPEHLAALSSLLSLAQECQSASRNAERSIRQFIKSICVRLR